MGSTARERHREEFEAFVRLSGPSLLRAGFLLTGDLATAEDLAQTTLLRTFVHWHRARQAPKAYANQVLLNLARDRWRKLARNPVQPLAEIGSGAGRSLGLIADRSVAPINELVERDAMLQALALLPDRQRDVIVLRFYLDLTVAETARILEVPEGTVKSSVSRALDRLRDLFETEPTAGSTEVPHAH
jgi:RNA polymerase sigma-70 factor (sigma-E family)